MRSSELDSGRRAWEEFASARTPEDIGRLLEGWDPDVEYVEDPKWPGADTFRGYAAVAARFREYVDVLGMGGELVLEDVRETPGGLVSLVRVRGDTVSGVPFDHLWAYRFRMHGGLQTLNRIRRSKDGCSGCVSHFLLWIVRRPGIAWGGTRIRGKVAGAEIREIRFVTEPVVRI